MAADFPVLETHDALLNVQPLCGVSMIDHGAPPAATASRTKSTEAGAAVVAASEKRPPGLYETDPENDAVCCTCVEPS